MALTPGTRIGAYEVVALLGEGGMGQVYRARDGKLNREVALKILPELFTADPDRLARFRREAQVLASLNHLDRLQVTTEPVQVLDGVVTKPSGAANFAVSRDGTLAYLPGRAPTLSFNVALMDRTGLLTQVPVPARAYRGLRASPNGRLLAGSIETESAADNEGVWTIDLARATSDRLTPPGVVATTPVWHPQGEAIAYWSPPGKEPGGIFQIATTGTGSPQRLTTSTSARHLPTSWSPDGRHLLFTNILATGADIYRVVLGGTPLVEPVLAGPTPEGGAKLSPDGRWMLYGS